MKKTAMSISYELWGKLYLNITNKCPCACTFCLRQNDDGAYGSDPLWLEHQPDYDEVIENLKTRDLSSYKEIIFCGYGEPTCALSVMSMVGPWLKRENCKTRLNTNGLANLEYGQDITPRFAGILDTISISLNASNAQRYYELTRAKYGLASYDGMLDFAVRAKAHVPHVVLTIVDHVEGPEEIERCRELCEEKGLTLRVRPYEAN